MIVNKVGLNTYALARDLKLFTTVKIPVLVAMPCNVLVEYQRFGDPCCLRLQDEVIYCFYPEVGCSMDRLNVDILPQHYMASQPRRLGLESKRMLPVNDIYNGI